jgi:hypothetical protein
LSAAKKLSVYGHHRAEVLLHQLGIVVHRLAERAEDDALLGQRGAKRRPDRHRVEDRVDGDAGQDLLFVERDAELVERLAQLGVHFVQAVEDGLFLRRRVVADGLVVDLAVVDVVPRGLGHAKPAPVRLQAEFEHPFRLALFGRERANDVLVETGRKVSASMSVTKPYLYSRVASCSMVSVKCSSFSGRTVGQSQWREGPRARRQSRR